MPKRAIKDKARSFVWTGKRIEILGEHSTMSVNKTDAFRLLQVCLAADPRWEVLPADWRDYLTTRKDPDA